MSTNDVPGRRTPDSALLRFALEELGRWLEESGGDPHVDGERLQRILSASAAEARRMGILPERYVVMIKRILDRHLRLEGERPPGDARGSAWARRDHVVSSAIASYFGAGGSAAGPSR